MRIFNALNKDHHEYGIVIHVEAGGSVITTFKHEVLVPNTGIARLTPSKEKKIIDHDIAVFELSADGKSLRY